MAELGMRGSITTAALLACPPEGHGRHRYRFKLFALNVGRLDVSPSARNKNVEARAEQHLVARAELTGTYER
jgi:phosphatidylethanolamine-binding protein (PEBP) family uncharacterized protein